MTQQDARTESVVAKQIMKSSTDVNIPIVKYIDVEQTMKQSGDYVVVPIVESKDQTMKQIEQFVTSIFTSTSHDKPQAKENEVVALKVITLVKQKPSWWTLAKKRLMLKLLKWRLSLPWKNQKKRTLQMKLELFNFLSKTPLQR